LDLCHEVPDRASALFAAMEGGGFLGEGCLRVEQVAATTEELMAPAEGGATNGAAAFYTSTVHSAEHVAPNSLVFADPASYIVDGSEAAARLAAGGVLAVTRAVCTGAAANAFAVVRPPGHHACGGCGCVQGFCIYNNVAVAAANARRRGWLEAAVAAGAGDGVVPARTLIIDFDIHHGDGIEQIFYRDRGCVYISIHRGAIDGAGLETKANGGREKGFFPGTGLATSTGDGDGAGCNVNIPLEEVGMGDADYKLLFDKIVMPIARQFDPELVFVCAGFDAAAGDAKSQGEFCLTPSIYGYMVRQAMTLAHGRVVLALEGGYDISEICACGLECLRALKGHPPSSAGAAVAAAAEGESAGGDEVDGASEHALETLRRVVEIQRAYWTF
jgi:histone deacetylase 6